MLDITTYHLYLKHGRYQALLPTHTYLLLMAQPVYVIDVIICQLVDGEQICLLGNIVGLNVCTEDWEAIADVQRSVIARAVDT